MPLPSPQLLTGASQVRAPTVSGGDGIPGVSSGVSWLLAVVQLIVGSVRVVNNPQP